MIKKKYSAVDLTDLAIGIVVLGIVVSIGATILINARDTFVTGALGCNATVTTSCGVDYNLSNAAATGLAEYGNWFDIIVIVGVAAVILSLIFMAFGQDRGEESIGISY